MALKIIFANASKKYRLKMSGLETLKERRQAMFETFSRKVEENERFANKWLKKNDELCVSLRNREKYNIRSQILTDWRTALSISYVSFQTVWFDNEFCLVNLFETVFTKIDY